MSLLDMARQGAESLERLPLSHVASLEPYDFTLDVSENNLTSLDCPDTSVNTKVLRQVEILVAQQNDLRDLLNIQFTFPNLVVIDVSENSLETVAPDDQACLAEIPQLDTFIAAGNNMCNFSLTAFWPSLKVIDLSSNALCEVPNFAPYCPNLTTVDLSGNEIDNLQHLAVRLPPMIEQLFLSENRVDDWHRLAQLTAFAETLTTVSVQGNDFCARVKFSWKIFLAWLLPCATEIDGAAINAHERDAVNDLFCDAQNPSTFSLKHLAMMEDGKEIELDDYLSAHCRVTVRPNHPRRVSPTPSRAQNSFTADNGIQQQHHIDPHNNSRGAPASSVPSGGGGGNDLRRGRSPQPSPQKASAQNAPDRGSSSYSTPPPPPPQQQQQHYNAAVQQPTMAEASSASAVAAAPTAAVTQALQQLQGKVKVLQDVVKVLRQSDLTRRSSAARTIQRHYRGYLVRRHMLSEEQRKRLRRLHAATLVGFKGESQQREEKKGGATASLNINTSIMGNTNDQIQSQIDAMRGQLEHCTRQVQQYNRIAQCVQNRAAKTIQKYYRGFVARRGFATLQGAYKAFTAQYVGPAIKIQSAVRMFLQRKRFIRQLTKHREMEAMRHDNKMLKARMSAMEKAMAAILSRLETVEQLALLGAEGDLDDAAEGGDEGRRGVYGNASSSYNASQSLPSVSPASASVSASHHYNQGNSGSSLAAVSRQANHQSGRPAAHASDSNTTPASYRERMLASPQPRGDADDDEDDFLRRGPTQMLNRRDYSPSL